VLLNILALAATVGVAYMSAAQGVYRAVQILAACLVAGVLAFGLCGPLAGIGDSTNATSIWYYAGDAFFLWAVFCAVFMGLRMACDKFLPNQPALPYYINFPSGAVVGLATGYLAVGVCLVLAQMLPLAPDILGYAPFDYTPTEGEAQFEKLETGERLWLSWDRGALALFGYLSSAPLGSDASSFYNRYGDVYPPPELRPVKYEAVVNTDDVLYFHWYRRYQAVRWRQYSMPSPLPRRMQTSDGMGLQLEADRMRAMDDIDVRVLGVVRRETLDSFPQMKPPADTDFLKVTLLFKPVGRLPRTVDSAELLLVTREGEKRRQPPLIYGATKPGEEPKTENIVRLSTAPKKVELRNVRFGPGDRSKPGHYLADGATFEFATPRDRELETFVFTLSRAARTDSVRLLLESATAPAKPEAAPATPAKPGPAKTPAKP
jgi:hypothetical protein